MFKKKRQDLLGKQGLKKERFVKNEIQHGLLIFIDLGLMIEKSSQCQGELH